jgi:hypothetical protein
VDRFGKTKVGDFNDGWIILGQEDVLQGDVNNREETKLKKEVAGLQVSNLDARHPVSGCT